jgi:hypothetical protein
MQLILGACLDALCMISSNRLTKTIESRESCFMGVSKLVPFYVIYGALPQPWTGFRPEGFARVPMKPINPKFAANTCLFALLATPAAVFAEHHGDNGKGKDSHEGRNLQAVFEPSM